jgi:hypothetical protein
MNWICEVIFTVNFFSVILPQLAGVAAYALHMSNQTRKLDLAVGLVEAFSSAVYCALSKQTISTALLPGLRYGCLLENHGSMDEIRGTVETFYVVVIKNLIVYMWGRLSEALIRGACYMYICSFWYGTVSKENNCHFMSVSLVQVLRATQFQRCA